jgi:hypothetical protein
MVCMDTMLNETEGRKEGNETTLITMTKKRSM